MNTIYFETYIPLPQDEKILTALVDMEDHPKVVLGFEENEVIWTSHTLFFQGPEREFIGEVQVVNGNTNSMPPWRQAALTTYYVRDAATGRILAQESTAALVTVILRVEEEDSELFRFRHRGNMLILFNYSVWACSSCLKRDLAF